MAKKPRKRQKYETDINMTPMIDVVFNLIIFFMVITDMSQKDLEYLYLPRAEEARPDDGKDRNRIIVNIINFDLEESKNRIARGEIDPKLPPVFVDGHQMPDLPSLRRKLRELADPRLYPDKTKNPVGNTADGQPLYPSDKPLLVRCDQGQAFGWVQAIMQYCTIVPGRPMAEELRDSPMIYKLEIAVAEKDAPK